MQFLFLDIRRVDMRFIYSITLIFSLFITSFTVSSAQSVPYKRISAPEVKYLLEKDNVLLVNVLSKISYDMQHIPNSIHIDITEIETSDLLPVDKSTTLIFHCMGKQCPLSERACKKAVKRGYSNIYWFVGGIPEWYKHNYPMNTNKDMMNIKIKKYSPKKVSSLVNKEPVVIIDVRPKEFPKFTSFIKDSRHIPLNVLHKQYTSINKEDKLIIVDAYMKQSQTAAKFLTANGFNVMGILKGGVARWEKEAYETIKLHEENN